MGLKTFLKILATTSFIFFLSEMVLDAFSIQADTKDSIVGDIFGDPVHETITAIAFCPGQNHDNINKYIFPAKVNREAIYWGVRWNDDPPDYFVGYLYLKSGVQPQWSGYFLSAKYHAKNGETFGPKAILLQRVHFGDLQFLHSMASKDGENPKDTQKHIMMWAEFTWKIATGSINENAKIETLGIEGLKDYFPKSKYNNKKGNNTAKGMFLLGNIDNKLLKNSVSEAALGSLLHLVQDSFTKSHVTREKSLNGDECKDFKNAPGAIVQFHNYINQDEKKHRTEDTMHGYIETLQDNPDLANVVDISRKIVQLWQEKANWQTTNKYLQCVFALSSNRIEAGPGEEFRSTK